MCFIITGGTSGWWFTGNDFICLGNETDLGWVRNQIMKLYEVKFRGRLGPGARDMEALRILNRIINISYFTFVFSIVDVNIDIFRFKI